MSAQQRNVPGGAAGEPPATTPSITAPSSVTPRPLSEGHARPVPQVPLRTEEDQYPLAEAVAEKVAAVGRSAANAKAKAGVIARGVSDAIECTAEYLRQHDRNDMAADLEKNVRRNPTGWLAAAAAAGLLIGVALRARD
jgi:ElaB/YqjD/DUF883 family membrane-anchored ribosome-binding protein